MKEQLNTLLASLKEGNTAFSNILQFIEKHYTHQPTAFKNGEAYNEAIQNQGSAKVFGFAQLNHLSAEDTLWLFAEHYRAVLDNPEGNDHQNIRQFMANGWAGIAFEGTPLVAK